MNLNRNFGCRRSRCDASTDKSSDTSRYASDRKSVDKSADTFRFSRYLMIFMLLMLAILSIENVYSLTGTSGSITLDGSVGTISYNGNISSINSYGISEYVVGNYSTLSGIEGWFGFDINTSSEQNISNGTITISLDSPNNDSGTNTTSVDFIFTASGVIDNCSIYLDGNLYGVYTNIISGFPNVLAASGLSIDRHAWNVSCENSTNRSWSETREFTVLLSSQFDGNTTDLSQVNISIVPNLTLSKNGIGTIHFDGLTDLSAGFDLNSNIIISPLSIYLNSAVLTVLNKSATLTMYNVPYNNLVIWKDGAICTSCSVVSLNSGVLVFNVNEFSTYTVTGSTALDIFDSTEFSAIHSQESVSFYANYSNVSNNQPIPATCTISFNYGGWTAPVSMNYNSSNGLYYYNTTFSSSGVYSFNVSCTNVLGFDDMSAIDSYTISSDIPTTFSEVESTLVGSSRTNLTHEVVNVSSNSGDLNELRITHNSVSESWQGYYGNISGSIMLMDSNSNTLYNWNMTNIYGEIYATRTTAVKWYNIRCANNAEIVLEDSYLGMDNTSADSIEKTFYNTTNFNLFYVGYVLINSSQNCYATNLYDQGGQQNNYFSEILLTDNNNIVYTGIIDNDIFGFDGRQHDFEMLVGENGHNGDTDTTMYYFYAELG